MLDMFVAEEYATRMSTWVYDDGGRAAAGFKGAAGDCAVRSIAIATGLPYRQVYGELQEAQQGWVDAGRTKAARGVRARHSRPSVRNGVWMEVMRPFLANLGWTWIPTMFIGSGTTVHLGTEDDNGLRTNETYVVRCSKHFTAMIDGVIHDTHDPSRDGTRAVYGYWVAG